MRWPHTFAAACLLTIESLLCGAEARPLDARPPNVVVILADDQGWGDLRLNGNTNLATPNIDSLARNGAVFSHFYVSPVCSPTRAEFLTGRYHPRTGVRGVTAGGERLNLNEKTIAEVFRTAGYATGAFGKWHNGTQWPYHPRARGFDEFYGFTSGHWGSYFYPPLDHNGIPVQGKGYLPDDLTEQAIGFIQRNKDKSFFCYVPLNTPHSPMQVPDRFYQKFAKADLPLRGRDPDREDLSFTRAALAMCENIDWNVGRIMQRLEALRLTTNTIVVYFSDNGPNSPRWNGGMRGHKGSTDEGGVRSPLIVRWSGCIPPGTQIEPISGAIDLLPTLVELAGIPHPPSNHMDGLSLAPLLLGTATNWPDRTIFSHWNGKTSARTQTHRLDAQGRLYQMVEDPGQTRDVSAKNAETAKQLSSAVENWRKGMNLPQPKDARPFTAGYPEMPLTVLPARDGQPHGGIERSASAPNCSYFKNWTQPDDAMSWDVEIHTPGKYEVEVLYTCLPEDTGATIELAFNGVRLEGVVTVPNDPPTRGAENDRVPRQQESYVKDFKPLRIGYMELAAGRGNLKLSAVRIAGREVMEVREVRLRLFR